MQSRLLIVTQRRTVFKICTHSSSELLKKGWPCKFTQAVSTQKKCSNSDGLCCKSSAIRKTALVTLQLNRFNFSIWDFYKMYFSHTVEVWSTWQWPQKNKLSVNTSTTCWKIISVWFTSTSSFYCSWYKEINTMWTKIKTKVTQMFIFLCHFQMTWFKTSFYSIKVVVAFPAPKFRFVDWKKFIDYFQDEIGIFPLTVTSWTIEVLQFSMFLKWTLMSLALKSHSKCCANW